MLMQGAVILIADNGDGQAGTSTVYTGLSDCEKMGLRSNISQKLPNMYDPRADFNPCELHNSLYLFGGGSAFIEVFNLSVCTFTQIRLDHPETDSPCCVFAVQGVLVAISRNYVVRWAEEVQVRPHKSIEVLSNLAPVLDVARAVVYLVYEGWGYTLSFNGVEQ